MDFKKHKPIYQQIADQLEARILSGELGPDDRMPSVRDVAAQLGVNPNTVMRTFEHLQQHAVIHNRRGVGYFVATDAKERILDEQRQEFINEELPQIRQRMKLLGISFDELKGDEE